MDIDEPRAHGLHKGALGAVLLAEEVAQPERAPFPGLLAKTQWT